MSTLISFTVFLLLLFSFRGGREEGKKDVFGT